MRMASRFLVPADPRTFKFGIRLLFQLSEDGILLKKEQLHPVIAVPKSHQQRAIHIAYNTQIVGHTGEKRCFFTYANITTSFR